VGGDDAAEWDAVLSPRGFAANHWCLFPYCESRWHHVSNNVDPFKFITKHAIDASAGAMVAR
jgi:hypothetical protein